MAVVLSHPVWQLSVANDPLSCHIDRHHARQFSCHLEQMASLQAVAVEGMAQARLALSVLALIGRSQHNLTGWDGRAWYRTNMACNLDKVLTLSTR